MSDEQNDYESEVLVRFDTEVSLVRVIGKHFLPSTLMVTADVLLNNEMEDDEIDFAFAKINFWFSTLVSKAVVFCPAEEDSYNMMVRDKNSITDNPLMLTPQEPTDEHLAAILQAKLSALGGDAITFASVEVASNNMSGLSFCYIGDGKRDLPTMEKWIGERAYFDEPWWNRNDGSMMDTVLPDGADASIQPSYAINLDFLRQIANDDTTGDVIRPSFSPTVIDGDQDD